MLPTPKARESSNTASQHPPATPAEGTHLPACAKRSLLSRGRGSGRAPAAFNQEAEVHAQW
jgi:hypothetical protein